MNVFIIYWGITLEVFTWMNLNVSHCTLTITSCWRYSLSLRQSCWHWTNEPTVRQTDRQRHEVKEHFYIHQILQIRQAKLCQVSVTSMQCQISHWAESSTISLLGHLVTKHTDYIEYMHPFKSSAPVTPGTPLYIPVHGQYLVLRITSLWTLRSMIQLVMWQRFPWSVYSCFGKTEWGHMSPLHATKTYWHHQTAMTICVGRRRL